MLSSLRVISLLCSEFSPFYMCPWTVLLASGHLQQPLSLSAMGKDHHDSFISVANRGVLSVYTRVPLSIGLLLDIWLVSHLGHLCATVYRRAGHCGGSGSSLSFPMAVSSLTMSSRVVSSWAVATTGLLWLLLQAAAPGPPCLPSPLRGTFC